jgi:hypothetical protein
MTTSILDGKKILTVDDEPDILDVLEEESLRCAAVQNRKSNNLL